MGIEPIYDDNGNDTKIDLFFLCPFVVNEPLHLHDTLLGAFCLHNATFFYQTVFDALDVSKDGKLSLKEYSYCILSFFFHSGPDDPISLYYGDLVDDSSIMTGLEQLAQQFQQQ